MAEDITASRCKRGHLRIPENTYVRPSDGARQCRPCRKWRKARNDAIYLNTPKGRANRRQAQVRYEATTKGWATGRKYKLKGKRERIQGELAALERQEAECLKSLEQAIARKSSGQGQSTSLSDVPSGDSSNASQASTSSSTS